MRFIWFSPLGLTRFARLLDGTMRLNMKPASDQNIPNPRVLHRLGTRISSSVIVAVQPNSENSCICAGTISQAALRLLATQAGSLRNYKVAATKFVACKTSSHEIARQPPHRPNCIDRRPDVKMAVIQPNENLVFSFDREERRRGRC
jgi:hypothetical protein